MTQSLHGISLVSVGIGLWEGGERPVAGEGHGPLAEEEGALDPIGPCQALEPQSGSQSAPLRHTPQTRLSALDMQWPRAFILLLPAARLRS